MSLGIVDSLGPRELLVVARGIVSGTPFVPGLASVSPNRRRARPVSGEGLELARHIGQAWAMTAATSAEPRVAFAVLGHG